jgi:hypothetical protein
MIDYKQFESPIEPVREAERQAQIRELYYKISQLQTSLDGIQITGTGTAVEETAPPIISSIVNYLDNSDFRFSLGDYYPDSALENKCAILDRWHSTNASPSNYTRNTDSSVADTVITETSSLFGWDPVRHIVKIRSGRKLASHLPINQDYASPGNVLFFRMEAVHYPQIYAVEKFSDGGLVEILFSTTAEFNLQDGMLVDFLPDPLGMIPENGKYVKPESVSFSEVLEVFELQQGENKTVQTAGGEFFTFKTFSFRLKRFSTGEAVSNMGTYTFNFLEYPNEKKEYCRLGSRVHPDLKVRASVLEEKDGVLQVYPGEDSVSDELAEVSITNRFYSMSGYASTEIVGAILVPNTENPYNRGPQWLEVEFLVGDLPASSLQISNETLLLDKVGLSSNAGNWQRAVPDSDVSIVCTRTTPTSLISIFGGGRGGTAGGGTSTNLPTRQFEPPFYGIFPIPSYTLTRVYDMRGVIFTI